MFDDKKDPHGESAHAWSQFRSQAIIKYVSNMLSICIQIKGHCYDGSRFVLSVWCWQACSFWMLPSTNPRYLEPPGAARYESWCTFVQISRCRRLWPARLSSIINLDASFDHGKGAVALRVRFMQSCATTRMLLFCESMQFQLPETVLELHGAHSWWLWLVNQQIFLDLMPVSVRNCCVESS